MAEGADSNKVQSCPDSASGIIKLKGLFGLQINTQEESVIRPATLPFPPVKANPSFVNGVASRDVVISDSPSIWARIFLPERVAVSKSRIQSAEDGEKKKIRVPVILYFHGGGFVMLSPDIAFYHQHCERLARRANAIVVSIDYRLAPEYRLPAAYEDAYESLRWLRSQATLDGDIADPWLTAYADLGRVVLAGDSAGANVAHHVAMRAADAAAELLPVAVRGQVLLQPMVGGVGGRRRSEVEGARSGFFSFQTNDWLWRLALPRGCDMSHPYCDLATAVGGPRGGRASPSPPPLVAPSLVALGGLDWMHDRQVDYVASLRRSGCEVELLDYEHAKHGFFIYDYDDTSRLLRAIASFIDKRSKM